MTDLKKVMERLNSQKSKATREVVEEPPKKKVIVPEFEEEEQEDEDGESPQEKPKEKVKTVEESETPSEEERIQSQISLLQNTGIFRYELLAITQSMTDELKVLNYQLNKLIGDKDEDGKS